VLDHFGLRQPKVWLLTGLYELDGARIYEMQKSEQGGEAAVDSLAIGAITEVSMGSGIDLGSGCSFCMSWALRWTRANVWAAQYRRLDIRNIEAQPDTTIGQLPARFSLLPDVASPGMLRSDNSEMRLAVVQALELGESMGDGGSG
jgi:hypothetical protein